MKTGIVAGSALRAEWAQAPQNARRPAAAHPPGPGLRKLEHAAAEFEGILLSSLWQAWNKSDQMGNEQDPIAVSMTAMGTEMASIAMAEKGGIGIARMIVNSLKGKVNGQPGN